MKIKMPLNILSKEKGATMLEYALLSALIAVVCIAAVTLLGTNASTTFSRSASSIAID